MNFIKKNYEKLILAVLLAVFIILLALQLLLWNESSAIQVEKLKQFRDPPPNYETVKFDDKKSGFMVLETLMEFDLWNRSANRGGSDDVDYTDMMQPYPMALCPHCRRVIPATAFPKVNTLTINPCPLCRKDLYAPLRAEQNVMLDTDGDNIPDQAEKLLKLNPEDPTDGFVDSDADGFSNYEEYLFKTKINDSKDRPPYYTLLHVSKFECSVLPFRLKRISVPNPKDLRSATAQIEVDRVKPRPPLDVIIPLQRGKSFEALGKVYEILEVNVLPRPQNRRNLPGNEYEIIVRQKGTNGRISMRRGLRVRGLTADEIHLVYSSMGKTRDLELKVNSEFTLGSMRTGTENYKVLSMDQAKKEVVLLFNGKEITIGAESALRKKIKQAPKLISPPRKKKKKQ